MLDRSIADPSTLQPPASQLDDSHSTNSHWAEDGAHGIVQGWKPEHPIIGRDTRVIALGGCFGRTFILWLAEHGLNCQQPVPPHDTLLTYPSAFESAPVLARQLRWAFGDRDSADATEEGADTRLVQGAEEQREAVRKTLQDSDVLIWAITYLTKH
jgi:hypothetical protein